MSRIIGEAQSPPEDMVDDPYVSIRRSEYERLKAMERDAWPVECRIDAEVAKTWNEAVDASNAKDLAAFGKTPQRMR